MPHAHLIRSLLKLSIVILGLSSCKQSVKMVSVADISFVGDATIVDEETPANTDVAVTPVVPVVIPEVEPEDTTDLCTLPTVPVDNSDNSEETPANTDVAVTPVIPEVEPEVPTDLADNSDNSEVDPPLPQTSEFLQMKADRYDFLWVVDNAIGMNNILPFLRDNLGGFFLKFGKTDYQMGFITMDMSSSDAGALVQEKIIRAPEANLLDSKLLPASPFEVFLDLVRSIIPPPFMGQVQGQGQGQGQGLAASLAHLSRNSSWLRENTPLVVIYVSDRDDRSPVGTEGQLIDFLIGSGKPFRVFSVVIPSSTPSGERVCPGYPIESVGHRYISFAENFGKVGLALSLCKSDIVESFNEIALSLTVAGHAYRLREIPKNYPDMNSVRVFVDGVQAVQPNDNFYYDHLRNLVLFDSDYEPAINGRVRIEYSLP